MENQCPWLMGRMGKKCCLLAKDENAFYLIEVGKKPDRKTEEELLRGISGERLKELELAFEYIPRTILRGVAWDGTRAGDTIYLYLETEKRKLEMEYREDRMECFFENIQWFTPPKNREPGVRGWRKQRQDPQLFQKLRYVSPAFLAAGAAAGIAYVATWHWAFFTMLLLCLIGILGFTMAMPVYFTIHQPKGKKKHNVWDLEWPLLVVGMFLFLGFRLNWMSYRPLLYILPLGAVFGALVYWRAVDLHQESGMLFSALILGAFIALLLAGQVNEVYDFTPPESYVLEVEGLRTSTGKNRSYYCEVTLPDGQEAEISVSAKLYRQLEEGDRVRVERDVGLLGIEYARVTGEE